MTNAPIIEPDDHAQGGCDAGAPPVLDYCPRYVEPVPTIRAAVAASVIPLALILAIALGVLCALMGLQICANLFLIVTISLAAVMPISCLSAVFAFRDCPKPWYVRVCIGINLVVMGGAVLVVGARIVVGFLLWQQRAGRSPPLQVGGVSRYNRGVNLEQVRELLLGVAGGGVSVEQAVERLRALPFEQLPFATIDHHRAMRCGHPEVIFCPGKTIEHAVEIARRLSQNGGRVLATRASGEQMAAFREAFAGAMINEAGRAVILNPPDVDENGGAAVAVVSAGTADLPVAEEAMMTLRSMGVPTHRICDVGVSGVHRLLSHVGTLQQCCAVVVAAGMEGALPSVVGGLVACPVFAVPTSIGYGASLGGLTAMLAMLNSCASNVTVVNIDNGFGAAFSAALVWQQITRFAKK